VAIRGKGVVDPCVPQNFQYDVLRREAAPSMKNYFRPAVVLLSLLFVVQFYLAQAPIKWKIHDPNRPLPPVIDPGTASTPDTPGHPPSDAVVLFDGKDI
jgi:hypothetical protein